MPREGLVHIIDCNVVIEGCHGSFEKCDIMVEV